MNCLIKILIYFAGVFAALAVSSCIDDPEPGPEPGSKPDPDPVRRTVLVYQVANNNLGSGGYDKDDLKEMLAGARAGALGTDGRLLVYNAGNAGDALLLEVTSDGLDTLKRYDPSVLSVSSSRMLEVMSDVETNAPARDYGLILWSHGSGWLQDGISDDLTATTKSFGSDRGRTMNITTLAAVLEQGLPLSFIYFDCCYMASVETLYELRNAAPVIVGSATELQVEGMPYDKNLIHFFAEGDARLIDAAKETFDWYDDMVGIARTATMSVVSTAGLDELAAATAAIYAAADVPVPDGFEPQRFMNKGVSACTYFDFAQYVRSLTDDSSLLRRFDEALDACVLYAAATPMLWSAVPLKYHCGLSTYILRNRESISTKNYNTLQWYDDVASKLNLQ